MNGPMKMYRTKAIIKHDLPVDIPKCMYAMKNIHSKGVNGMVDGKEHVTTSNKNLDIFDQVKQFLKNNHNIGGMAELEAKQEKILKQLADLKQQILAIKGSMSLAVPTPAKLNETKSNQQVVTSVRGDLQDIVVNASSANPPYSLEIIQKLLQDRVSLIFTTHLHSTVSSLSEDAEKLGSILVNFSPKSSVPRMNVKLIWKNVDNNLELLVSSTRILGEVNLLRYLVRVTGAPLNYDSDQDLYEIDSLLDVAYLIVKSKTKTERTSLLQSLNKSLGKSQWLAGRSKASVADVAAYSAIRQACSTNEMTANLGKWFQRCGTVA